MSDVIGSIGSMLGGAAPIIGGVSAGTGLIGNIMNSIQRGGEIDRLKSAEKKFESLTPEQLSGLVSRAEQPLGQDLLQNVGNIVQADMATRGLSQSPGIFAATETQALAPYKLQQQQMALQMILKQMGLPIEYATAILQGMGGSTNLAPLLQLLMKGGTGATPNQVPDTSNIPSDVGAIIQNIITSGGAAPGLTTGGDFPSTQPGGG